MRTSSAPVLAFLSLVGTAVAADLGDDVPGHPGVTYDRLLRRVMPDLAKDKNNWSGIASNVRDTSGKPQGDTFVAFSDIETLTVRERGRARLLVLTGQSMGDSFSSILAVFDTATLKLLDYMDVGGDRFVSFGEPHTLKLSRGSDAFTIDIDHNNAQESFVITTVLFLDRGRLRQAANLFTFGVGMCEYQLTETPAITVRPDPGHAFNAIVVSARQEVKHSGEDCGENAIKPPKQGIRTFRDVYRWNGRRFVSKTRSLAGLIGPED